MQKMWKEFKEFAFSGNVIDLAVAVVLGVAFTALVQAVVKDIVTPLIAAVFGKPDFSALYFSINKSQFLYGDLINFIINFLAIALVLFLVVRMVKSMKKKTEDLPPDVRNCPACLEIVPAAATRCKHCTSELTPTGAA